MVQVGVAGALSGSGFPRTRKMGMVDGRSVLSLLSLAASTGTRLRIRATGSDAREAVEALVRREMGGAYPLDVPLDVSVGVGRTWDEAGH